MKPIFFKSPADFRAWLDRNHASADALLVGFYKVDSGKPSITWPESVDQALCFGWIDGIRRRIDDLSYTIRFTPRRPGSVWSGVNIRRVAALVEQNLMHPAGLKAYEARRENKSGIYSYEQRSIDLPPPYDRLLKKSAPAWRFFQSQPPSYRKAVCWWIVSAKKDETRLKRLEKLAALCGRGQRLPQFRSSRPTPHNRPK